MTLLRAWCVECKVLEIMLNMLVTCILTTPIMLEIKQVAMAVSWDLGYLVRNMLILVMSMFLYELYSCTVCLVLLCPRSYKFNVWISLSANLYSAALFWNLLVLKTLRARFDMVRARWNIVRALRYCARARCDTIVPYTIIPCPQYHFYTVSEAILWSRRVGISLGCRAFHGIHLVARFLWKNWL